MTGPSVAASAAELDTRRTQARALLQAGRSDEARRAFEDVLRIAADDAEALNALAVDAHGRGRPDEACALLEQALAAHPDDTTVLSNLGVLQRERNDFEAARASFARASELAPDLFATRLRLGETLLALGRPEQALPVCFGAIFAAQQVGRWLGDASTEPALRPLVTRLIRFVAAGRHQLFNALLAPLRERHGAAALARVDKALAIHLGELQPRWPDPAQRPKFLFFPDLPTERVVPRERFPWYAALEAQTAAIRGEMQRVLAEDTGFEPFLGHFDDAQLEGHLRSDRGAPVWNAFFFHRHGRRNEANAARCPLTMAAVEAVPLCRVREHAPEVCFSVLTPGSHILPHRGVTNTRLVTHLPLVVPEGDLALDISGHLQRWEEGRCFSFDDTFEHAAWNRSAHTRVVLLLDVWNPYLTDIECEALTHLISGIGDFNREAGA